jgi:putative ABC transport system substrate-binding protein
MADAAPLARDTEDFARDPNGNMIVIQGPFTTINRERIVSLAAEHRLPSVYPLASFAEIGGLVSYGVNVPAMWQGSAAYVDRILRGAKSSELSVREPEQPEIMVNVKTAKALNLTIPEALRSKLAKLIE